MELVFTLDSINNAANTLWEKGQDKKVWAFHGDMGSGKTTFIHSLCEALGVTTAIGSPTYSIINEYQSPVAGTIYHMDWYRLKNEEEAVNAGVEEAVYSNNYCFVEWPDRAPALLPDETLHVKLTTLSPCERSLKIEVA